MIKPKSSSEICNEVNEAVRILVKTLESGRMPNNESEHDELISRLWFPADELEKAIDELQKELDVAIKNKNAMTQSYERGYRDGQKGIIQFLKKRLGLSK